MRPHHGRMMSRNSDLPFCIRSVAFCFGNDGDGDQHQSGAQISARTFHLHPARADLSPKLSPFYFIYLHLICWGVLKASFTCLSGSSPSSDIISCSLILGLPISFFLFLSLTTHTHLYLATALIAPINHRNLLTSQPWIP